MKKKEEIYVVIDTPKNAKKVKKVLDIFGLDYSEYPPTCENNFSDWQRCYGFADGKWQGIYIRNGHNSNKTEVSIKELRNILAIEHLNEGDVVMCRNKKADTHIFEIEKKFGNSVTYEKRYSFVDSKTAESVGSWTLDYFIRYATEEEKALLEDKPKLEAGKWYTFAWSDQPNDVRGIYFIEKVEDIKVWFSYGIDFIENGWQSKDWCNVGNIWKEATKEEVEQALIKEAKKRGYVEGARIKCLQDEQEYTLTSRKHWSEFDGKELLMVESEGTGVWIFQNGKWAEIVEPVTVKPVINGKDLKVVLDGKPLRCESNVGKRVRVIDGGVGARGANGKTGVLVNNSTTSTCGFSSSTVKVKTDDGEVWGLNNSYHKIEYITESSHLTVSLEIKDIAVIEQLHDLLLDGHGYSINYKPLKDARELAQKLTKLI